MNEVVVDTRLLPFVLWGVGTVVVYGDVLRRRVRSYRMHLDPRSRHDVISAGALFIVAFSAMLSIGIVLFGSSRDAGSVLVALSLGAFTAAGVVMRGETPDEGGKR